MTNAQNLNAKALLARFSMETATWSALHYGTPDERVTANPALALKTLQAGRLWPWHAAALYQSEADAIFYPGVEWFDSLGLRLRAASGRSVPVIATIEGLAGDLKHQEALAAFTDHPVACQIVSSTMSRRIETILNRAQHIFALSPFLGRIAGHLYGNKVSVLPLGYDSSLFHARGRTSSDRARIMCAAGVRSHKRPGVFVDLARRFPDADFVWYGEGELRPSLSAAALKSCKNLTFPGPISQQDLAAAMRRNDILILPSLSEGTPKVTLEAAASGLAQIVFGHYETPTVADGKNGYVVWSDTDLMDRLAKLLAERDTLIAFSTAGIAMAAEWTWESVAPLWEARIIDIVRQSRKPAT